MSLRPLSFLAAAILGVLATTAQAQPALGGYNPLESFAPLTLPQPASVLRDGSGSPGPAYWQNRVDYALDARIDTAAHVLTGEET
ncbi:MAG TPA: M1 family peptidase, partial [Phenylobacterium sp.]